MKVGDEDDQNYHHRITIKYSKVLKANVSFPAACNSRQNKQFHFRVIFIGCKLFSLYLLISIIRA